MSKADRHSEALLGIHLAKTQGRAEGSPPSDEELVLLMDGQLSEQRRSEVLSHLAHRPERYRQWLSLADMDADEQASQAGLLAVLGNAINHWLIDWRYAAGGIGALAVLVLLVNQMALPPAQHLAEMQQGSDPYAHVPVAEDEAAAYSAKSAEPTADAISRLQDQRLEMARERSQLSELSQLSEQPAAAKRFARAPATAACLSTTNPLDGQAGTLCAVATENNAYELRWLKTEAQSLPLIELPARPLQMLTSEDSRWLAVQTAEAIYVFNLTDAFAGDIDRSQLPFNAATARLRWQQNTLVVAVMQALGDSDDDLIYHYLPETGEVIPPDAKPLSTDNVSTE